VIKQKKIAIEEKLALMPFELQSQSFNFKMVELKKLLQKIKSEELLTPIHLELIADLQQLEGLLLKNMDVSLN
jgi:Mn-containing catalase